MRGCEYGWDGWPSIFWGPVQLPPLPTRPKRMVKKTAEVLVNVYPGGELRFVYHNLGNAVPLDSNRNLLLLRLTGEYEVEE